MTRWLLIILTVCSFRVNGQTFLFPVDSSFMFPNNGNIEEFQTTFVTGLNWDHLPNQAWLGESFWCNSYNDWKLKDGKVIAHPFTKNRRTAHVSKYVIRWKTGFFQTQFRVGFSDPNDTLGFLGVLIGAGNIVTNNKANLLIHNNRPQETCFEFGVTPKGKVTLVELSSGDTISEKQLPDSIQQQLFHDNGLTLGVHIKTDNVDSFEIAIQDTLKQITKWSAHYNRINTLPAGSMALTYTAQNPFKEFGWIDDWDTRTNCLDFSGSTEVGAVISHFFTHTNDSLFLTAQLQPFKLTPDDKFQLRIFDRDNSLEVDEYEYDSIASQIRFRVRLPQFNHQTIINLVYDGIQSDTQILSGQLDQKKKKKKLKVMSLNCNGFPFIHEDQFDYSNTWYPYTQIEKAHKEMKPDLITFLGDQFYESRPNMPKYDPPFCYLDYLYKWNLFCLQFRELTQRTPSIIMPDDHDVFQGNFWGEGGKEAKTTNPDSLTGKYQGDYRTWQEDNGGYFMPKKFVNMVMRSQTSHLPQPVIEESNGVKNYFTQLSFKGVDFIVLEDRKFKSAPVKSGLEVYNGKIRNDTTYESFGPDSLTLLGKEQLNFLDSAYNTSKFKVVLSQTPYICATTDKNGTPNKDMDSNGWPIQGRNRALNKLGIKPTLVLSGDQHFASVIELKDSSNNPVTFFTTASTANTHPRSWNASLNNPTDGFGTPFKFLAIEPADDDESSPLQSSGFGIVEIYPKRKKAILHCYPLSWDQMTSETEFEGWPIKLKLKR